MGSLMIEENVVAEAGTVHYLTLDQIRGAIEELGFMPRQRNVFYDLIDNSQEELAISANRARYAEIRGLQKNGAEKLPAESKTQSNHSADILPLAPLSIVSGDGTA